MQSHMSSLKDSDLRAATHRRLLAHARQCPDTLVLDEFGLDHGSTRVDIAVINGHIRGVELKADADTLSRLPRQIAGYGKVVDKATLVAAERHIDGALKILPEWWGVIVATASCGGMRFKRMRPERTNRGVDPLATAKLLWRSEALQILLEIGCDKNLVRAPRGTLYSELAAAVPRRDLSQLVRSALRARRNWRDR